MNDLVLKAIDAVLRGNDSYCKFLTANDSGETGGHQSGILISKTARRMLFTEKQIRENHICKKISPIIWQNDLRIECTFTWYESKNELRITGFGRGFPYLRPEYTGALFVLIKDNSEEYSGYIFNTDDDIQDFLDSFGLTPADTNRLIRIETDSLEDREQRAMNLFIENLSVDFPNTKEMAYAARNIVYEVYQNGLLSIKDPDSALIQWTQTEYRLFCELEHARYGNAITNGFSSVDEFVVLANQVLNRRKSRAGKSLEHHLATVFDDNKIKYKEQAVTEGKKTPDFLFPSEEAYHDMSFSIDKLCTLAAKTTCKDRWRQILNEANRLRNENKFLCTLQQGISSAQMDEMQDEKVILVVPKPYIKSFPRDKQDRIWTIGKFVEYVKEIEK